MYKITKPNNEANRRITSALVRTFADLHVSLSPDKIVIQTNSQATYQVICASFEEELCTESFA